MPLDRHAPVDDDSSLPGRLPYARVSTVLGRFASRLASERYLGVKQDPAAMARELQNALGRLCGPVVKIAQLLATVPGALPSDYVAELVKLQAPAMGWDLC